MQLQLPFPPSSSFAAAALPRFWPFLACLPLAVVAWQLGAGDAAWYLLLLAPWIEETVCRWGVQDGLENAGLSPALAAVASAIVFAALHGLSRSWLLAAAVLPPALFLAVLYRHRRRLGTCVLWHAGFNAVWLAWPVAAAPWPDFLNR